MANDFWRSLLRSLSGEEPEEEPEDPAYVRRLQESGCVRRHYLVDGRVQEVGFRYTAYHMAMELKLTGWVSNLSDGRVEMELQGRPEKIDLLLERIDGKGRIVIERTEMEEKPLRTEKGFQVRG